MIEPDRATAFALAEPMLALAQSATAQKVSGQGGLFGAADISVQALSRPRGGGASWTPAERLEAEKAAFGFYLSGHPVDRYRPMAEARRARPHAELMAMSVPTDGRRVTAVTAALVEEARWRDTRGGRRFLMLTLSDATAQYTATCFDPDIAPALDRAAKEGACLLLDVELDRRGADEAPRVSVTRAEPLERLANQSALLLEVRAADAAAIDRLAALVEGQRGGRGEIVLAVAAGPGGERRLRLGDDFLLTPDLTERIAATDGLTAEQPRAGRRARVQAV